MMLHLIIEVLDELGVRREAHNELLREYNGSNCLPTLRMKIGTKDRRKIYMKGFVELENFNTEESMEVDELEGEMKECAQARTVRGTS